ncbi:YidH family protein [Oceanobacillus salinisoli]|uniref:YidH family protein n=1 Tax=Oceanobacillus salinisoli TaxID=2678611 RepID=UPI0012E2FD87|nr:DUF202 domain-containing protein [Oceanobacillus salinisoli]
MSEDKNDKSVDSKYIQQHLANERTFLAWIRTAIAIIGVGFLVTNMHFTMRYTTSEAVDYLAHVIGLASVGVGILTIILATVSYFKKHISINNQTFRTSRITLVFVGVLVIIIALVFGIYFLML